MKRERLAERAARTFSAALRLVAVGLAAATVPAVAAAPGPASPGPTLPAAAAPAPASPQAIAPAPAIPGAAPAAAASPLAPTGPQLGAPAPDFALHTLAGKTVTLAAFRGKTLVINAWATWCPPCRQEMPGFIAAYPKLAQDDVVMLGVDTTEGEAVVRAYAAAKAVPYALAVTTDDAFATAYDVQFFPTTFVIDAQGFLRARVVDTVTPAQLASFTTSARAGRNVAIVSDLQGRIDAKLVDPSIVFNADAGSVEANARRAMAAIAAAEDLFENAEPDKTGNADFARTRAEEATLRDRAIAALINVGTSVQDRTLLTRLRAAAALDAERWRDAAQAYTAVLVLVPNDPDALDGLARASRELHDDATAVDARAKLVARDPSNVQALVELARYEADAGREDEAAGTFRRAVAAAEQRLTAAPRLPSALRMLAYAHLYAGRDAAKHGERAGARAEFAEVARIAARLPANDARHDVYLEEAQEATVALALGTPNGFSVSLAPWTGADLPGSIASTFKYRLAIAGGPGRNVSLVASGVPKHWIASFCSDDACAPFKTSIALPPSGVKIVELQLVPPSSREALPKVRVSASDGRSEASAST